MSEQRYYPGLLDDDSFLSIHTIYAWWLGLRVVFNTFCNVTRKAEGGAYVDEVVLEPAQ
jgi:hypothetical protein